MLSMIAASDSIAAGRNKQGQAMTLQNRVDPFGQLQAEPSRGLFTGNRGVIHDPATKTLLSRRWSTKAWIICSLEHPRGIRREPMGRNGRRTGGAGWTELFFLDEVTALSAGHRPCFYCRAQAAHAFSTCFAAGMGWEKARAPAMDAVLHRQRLAVGGVAQFCDRAKLAALPNGAMIEAGGQAYALLDGRALPWSFTGYGRDQDLPERATLITPAATVAALIAGFRPIWHPSAS